MRVSINGSSELVHSDVARLVLHAEKAPALLLAAMGPQMLEIAGGRADGTLLWMTGPKAIADQIAPMITGAAEAADRPAPRIVCSLPIAVTDDEAGVRSFIG